MKLTKERIPNFKSVLTHLIEALRVGHVLAGIRKDYLLLVFVFLTALGIIVPINWKTTAMGGFVLYAMAISFLRFIKDEHFASKVAANDADRDLLQAPFVAYAWILVVVSHVHLSRILSDLIDKVFGTRFYALVLELNVLVVPLVLVTSYLIAMRTERAH